jgi:hypothetical protein
MAELRQASDTFGRVLWRVELFITPESLILQVSKNLSCSLYISRVPLSGVMFWKHRLCYAMYLTGIMPYEFADTLLLISSLPNINAQTITRAIEIVTTLSLCIFPEPVSAFKPINHAEAAVKNRLSQTALYPCGVIHHLI